MSGAPETLDLYCDGASRGNPGPASAGAVLLDADGKVRVRLNRAIGRATNNEAEYAALLLGLREAKRLGIRRIRVFADSELMVRQVTGVYRVKHPVLKERHREALELLASFETWSAAHVPREKNTEADRLANLALDEPGRIP